MNIAREILDSYEKYGLVDVTPKTPQQIRREINLLEREYKSAVYHARLCWGEMAGIKSIEHAHELEIKLEVMRWVVGERDVPLAQASREIAVPEGEEPSPQPENSNWVINWTKDKALVP